MDSTINIHDSTIGKSTSPYIIAELSGNHNGNINRAMELIDAASDAGANAVKLQTYTADTITLNSSKEDLTLALKAAISTVSSRLSQD